MIREVTAPEWMVRPMRWVWRLFTGQQLDALTVPLPWPFVLWLTRKPSYALWVHEVTHVGQIRRYWVVGAPFVWLWLWMRCGFSYRDHKWEREARAEAGQDD